MLKHTLAALGLTLMAGAAAALEPTAGATAPINGHDMYYEVHGETGEPLVLLHGAYMTIPTNWEAIIPALSRTHQVIAVELQGHGRTSDRDTPITYEGMADDVAGLLNHLGVEKAAVFGYSMGGGVAIRFAMQYPDRVSRLISASMPIAYAAFPDTSYDMIEGLTADFFLNTPFAAAHAKPGKTEAEFVTLFEKLRALDLEHFAWDEAEFAAIEVPSLLIFGDADIAGLDHIAKMHTLLGGILDGDSNGLPKTEVLVLPGISRINVFFNPANVEILKAVVPTFLGQGLPQAPQMPF